MYNFEEMDKRYIIFVNIFMLSNRLQTIMDSKLIGITTKQWLVIRMIDLFEEAPTLKQLAEVSDSSHQNIKQIVLKLEEKGFVTIKRDEKDKRVMRIRKTQKCKEFDESNEPYAAEFIDSMFSDLTKEEIIILNKVQQKVYDRLGVIKKEEEN